MSFASVGGLTSGSGSTVGTARDPGYALLQGDWDELRVIRSALDDPYVIVPSGATGSQINQIIADFPAGSDTSWRQVVGCNSSGERNGAKPTITCTGFGATTAAMLTFKPSQSHLELSDLILDAASSSSSTGSYNCISPTGEATPVGGGTNTTSSTYRFRCVNVDMLRPRHNHFSWWSGKPGAVSRHGVELIGCRLVGGGYASNACIIARPGTDGNCLSLLMKRCLVQGNITGHGLSLNNASAVCDLTIEDSVFAGNNLSGLVIATLGDVVLRRVGIVGNTSYGLQLSTDFDLLAEDCVIQDNVAAGINDLLYSVPSPSTNRLYRRVRISGNGGGELTVQDDGFGGSGPIDLYGEGIVRTPLTLRNTSGTTLEEYDAVRGGAFRTALEMATGGR